MPITERGRWTSSLLDERGKRIFNGLTETGQFVFNIIGVPVEETKTPVVTIISVDRDEISDEVGMNKSIVTFKFDTNVTAWTVNVIGVSPQSGIVADSGGAITAGTEITAEIDWTELYQEGENKVNIYGQNSVGWTPYEQ